MSFNIDVLFEIAAIGIIVAMMHSILKEMGKENIANWITVLGLVFIFFMVIGYLKDLFEEIQRVFLFK